jgi:uncharacterized membrane protein YeiH
MDRLYAFYNFLDLAGTFVFAISGAAAAKQRGLDLFGICAIAFTVACGGGIIRDLCIGAIPPAGLTNWHYLVAAIIATGMTVSLYSFVQRLNHPVLLSMLWAYPYLQLRAPKKVLHTGIMQRLLFF